MRSFRDIQAIVQDYPPAPDEEDLRRICNKHMENLHIPKDVSDWINHVDNPYLRELYATQTAIIVKEHCDNPICQDEAWNLKSYEYEEIMEDLALIASRAFGSQAGEELYFAERLAYTKPLQEAIVQSTPYRQDALAKIDTFGKRLDKIEERLDGQYAQLPHWPYFTAQATEDDKRTFEHFLLKLCVKDTKGISHEIKSYLKLKEQTGIIIRPSILDVEIEALRMFGYKSPDKTYYNA